MGLLDRFREKPEVREERERQRELQREEREIDATLASVRFFPGSQQSMKPTLGIRLESLIPESETWGLGVG